MSFNVAMLEAMQAEGLDLDACIRILRASGPDTAAEKRRAWDRERKREQREAERLSGGNSGGNPPDPAPNEIDNLTPTHEEKSETKVSVKKPKFSAPPGVGEDQWEAFRKQRKKAINERSYALLCNKLVDLADAGWPPGEMIDLAIERGWETVFKPWEQRNGRSDQHPTGIGRTEAAAIAALGPH